MLAPKSVGAKISTAPRVLAASAMRRASQSSSGNADMTPIRVTCLTVPVEPIQKKSGSLFSHRATPLLRLQASDVPRWPFIAPKPCFAAAPLVLAGRASLDRRALLLGHGARRGGLRAGLRPGARLLRRGAPARR